MPRMTIKTKIVGTLLLSTFLITTLLGYTSFEFSRQRLIRMIGDSIKGIAATAVYFINEQHILLIIDKAEEVRKTYEASKYGYPAKNYQKFYDIPHADGYNGETPIALFEFYNRFLANLKAINRLDGPINIYRKEGGTLKLVLTSENVLLIGAEYVMRPEVARAFAAGSPMATGIYKDKDGAWISAYAQLPSNHELLIEINYRVDSYMRRLRNEFLAILFICMIGFAAAAAISSGLVRRLVSAIVKLNKSATELERENYDAAVEIRSDDEIGHLAGTFEKLRQSIRAKIAELKLSIVREKKAHLESVMALTNAIEVKDPYTRKHLSRVEKYALLIAKEMKLPFKTTEKLRYSCYLHDIGKIGIDTPFFKKAELSKSDYEKMRKHSEQGARIIEGIEFLTEVKDVILYHQERYDGKGYPKGLKGEEIPLLARIVTVADAFDAMTSDRPYKPKISFKEAMEIIAKGAGTQFDPKVAEAFLKYRDTIEDIAKKHFG